MTPTPEREVEPDELTRRALRLDELLQEARRSKAALAERERHLRLLTRQLPAITFTADRELRLTAVRGAMLDALGLQQDELVGDRLERLLRTLGVAAAPKDSLRDAAEQLELRGERAGHVYETHLERFVDENGSSVGLLGIAVDVSEREASLEALRDSERRFRELVENISEVFFLESANPRKTLYVSPGYTRIWGRSPAELEARPRAWLDAVHPEDRDRVEASLGQEDAGAFAHEYRIVRPDGETRWVRVSNYPIRDELGSVVRLAGVAADVTERRRLEEELMQTRKMEAIGRLAGGIAHDFNNLLTAITGYCTLAEAACDEREPQLRDSLEGIRGAVDQAAHLTRQLLAFSRRQVPRPVRLEINDVVTGQLAMLERLLGETIDVRTELDAGAAAVTMDPGQLAQVLMNLALNARDAMPDGGVLTIKTEKVELGDDTTVPSRLHGQHMVLTITDTGCGMDESTVERIFEPFFTTKEPGEGTGLGLATVFGIVEQTGGLIAVDSEPGLGTTFRVVIPSTESRPATPTARPPASRQAGEERILLVEDNDAIRGLLTRGLANLGYRVTAAAEPAEALQLLGDDVQIDLLVTDMVMPTMNGSQLAAKLRAARPELRVLYISGYTDDAVIASGAIDVRATYLPKPFEVEQLAQKIRELLDA